MFKKQKRAVILIPLQSFRDPWTACVPHLILLCEIKVIRRVLHLYIDFGILYYQVTVRKASIGGPMFGNLCRIYLPSTPTNLTSVY